MIFKAVREGRPCPEHGTTTREWTAIPLEDGLHRALRCALQSRRVLHARVLRLPD